MEAVTAATANADTQMFLVKLPQDIARALRARVRGLPQGQAVDVGTMHGPAAAAAPDAGDLSLRLTYTPAEGEDGSQRDYNIRATALQEPTRVFCHEREPDASASASSFSTTSSSSATSQPGNAKKGKKRRALYRPQRVSFEGVVAHRGIAILDAGKDDAAFLEYARKLKAASNAREAKKKQRRTASVAVDAQRQAQGRAGVVSTNTSGASGSLSALRKQEGLRERSEARLSERQIRSALFEAFQVTPAMKLPEIQQVPKLKYQKRAWIKPVLATVADFHSESGELHNRYTLKEQWK